MPATQSLAQLIAPVGDQLTPTERRVAERLLDDPTLAAFGTVADVAARLETSGPTIVRFAIKLGFDGYTSLQQHVQSAMADQLKRASDRIRVEGDGSVYSRSRDAAKDAIRATFDRVSEADILALTKRLASAKTVWIVSSATSSAPAHVLTSGLRLVRPGVRHLTGSSATVATELADAGPGDVAIAIDFQRYEQAVMQTVRMLHAADVSIVAITDGPLAPIATLADAWVAVEVPAIGPFDSTLPAVAIAETMVAHVAHDLRGAATTRLDRSEALWTAAGTFAVTDEELRT